MTPNTATEARLMRKVAELEAELDETHHLLRKAIHECSKLRSQMVRMKADILTVARVPEVAPIDGLTKSERAIVAVIKANPGCTTRFIKTAIGCASNNSVAVMLYRMRKRGVPVVNRCPNKHSGGRWEYISDA